MESHLLLARLAAKASLKRASYRRHRPLRLESLEDRSLLAAFTPGNLVVYRVGAPATASLAENGSPVFVDEYTPSGVLVQSIAMPTVQEGLNRPLVANGHSATEGFLTRSADGRYLLLTGYDQALPGSGTALQSTPPIGVARVIGRVDWLGNVDTSMGLSDVVGGIHAVASDDGSQVWVSGQNGPIKRASFGASSGTSIVGQPATNNSRQLHIFAGQLYVSTSTRIASVGTGLPTSPATLSNPPALAIPGASGFYFADLTDAIPGFDTLYVAADSSTALSKYSLYDGVWTLRGTVGTNTDKYRGLTATVSGNTVTLYATHSGGTNAAGGGKLVKLVDSSGYDGNLAGVPSVLATAATQTALRGVALVPFADNNAPIYNTAGNASLPSITQVATNNQGVLVSELIASDGGDPITDLDPAALEGIAILATDDRAGQWQYSVNDGTDWNPVGSVSLTSSRLLAADVATRLRLVPNGTFTGTLSEALRFRAWDQTEGTNGGLLDTTGRFGADKPLSIAVESASLEVLAYTNTAPAISPIVDQAMVEDGTVIVSFTLSDDGELNVLTIAAASDNPAILPSANIALSGSGANRTAVISPLANQSGNVTITLTVSDGDLSSSRQFVLSVAPVNDAPTIVAIPDRSTDEDVALTPITIAVDDLEDPATLVVTALSDNPTLFPEANLTLSGTGTSRTLSAIPASNHNGTATITVTVTDSGGASITESFEIEVKAVNDLPTLSAIENLTTDEDTAPPEIAFVVGDIETPTNSISVTAASSDSTLFPTENLILGGSGPSRTLQIVPAANRFGTATITISVSDENGGSTLGTFTVTVTAANDPPAIAAIEDVSTSEDTAIAGVVIVASDLETSVEDLQITVGSSNPTLFPPANLVISGTGANRTLQMIPAADHFGTAIITVSASDESGGATSRTFTVTVTPINDSPSLVPIENLSTSEDTAIVGIALVATDFETSAGDLQITVDSSDPDLLPAANLLITGSGSSRTLQVTPADNRFGTATVTVSVLDGNGGTTSSTFTVTVTAVNDPPAMAPIEDVSAAEDTTIAGIPVIATDVETPTADLQIAVASSDPELFPAANLLVSGSGSSRSLSLLPAPNRSGSATITVTTSDGNGGSASRSFLVVVHPENDVPTISTIDDVSTAEDILATDISFTIADTEDAAAELVVTATSSDPLLFPAENITLLGNGATRTLRLSTAADRSGSAIITVAVRDVDGTIKTETFVVTVSPVNDLPSLSPVEDIVAQANAAIGPLTLTLADIDALPESLTVTAQSSNLALVPLDRISIHGNGSNRTVTIAPVKNQAGSATITLTLSDGDGGQAVETFTVTVAANQPPTLAELADQSLVEDEALADLVLSIDDGETGAAALQVSVTSDNSVLFPPGSLSIGGEGSERTLRLTPAQDQFGSAVITVSVTDENGAISSRTFNITVNSVNDTPEALDSSLSVVQDTSRPSGLLASDVDGPALTYSLASLPRKGIVTITDPATGSYIYRPYSGQYGPDRFHFQITDGAAVSNVAMVRVQINQMPSQAVLENDVLTVTGTSNDDYIVVAPFSETEVTVVVSLQSFGPFPTPDLIRIFGEGGRDYLRVHNLSIPAELDYGPEPDAQLLPQITSTDLDTALQDLLSDLIGNQPGNFLSDEDQASPFTEELNSTDELFDLLAAER